MRIKRRMLRKISFVDLLGLRDLSLPRCLLLRLTGLSVSQSGLRFCFEQG